jgi:hypothetical protein
MRRTDESCWGAMVATWSADEHATLQMTMRRTDLTTQVAIFMGMS